MVSALLYCDVTAADPILHWIPNIYSDWMLDFDTDCVEITGARQMSNQLGIEPQRSFKLRWYEVKSLKPLEQHGATTTTATNDYIDHSEDKFSQDVSE